MGRVTRRFFQLLRGRAFDLVLLGLKPSFGSFPQAGHELCPGWRPARGSLAMPGCSPQTHRAPSRFDDDLQLHTGMSLLIGYGRGVVLNDTVEVIAPTEGATVPPGTHVHAPICTAPVEMFSVFRVPARHTAQRWLLEGE